MNVSQAPIDQQKLWLEQRGWHGQPGRPGMWIDPDTRTSYCFNVALDRAIANCHIDSDMELKPTVPPRKDDSPPSATGYGPIK